MNQSRTGISRVFSLLALLLLFAFSVPAQEVSAKFDEYLSTLTKQGRFTGSALVARDGRVIFSKGYGMASVELDVPNSPETKFRIGSITKQFTAAAIMLLAERGKLSVNDPVCKYFSDCPAAWSEITIHHLLSHTSGLPNYTSLPSYREYMTVPVTNESLVARFRDKPLDFKPGEKWSYSNSGYFILGIIIEKVTGDTYETFLQKNIFDPLRLKNTGYDRPVYLLKHRATGYSMQNGKQINSLYLDMTQPGAAGALYSTVGDLMAWTEALHSDRLLSARSREAMMTPVKNNYGYGLTINTQFNRSVIGHGGGINGFSTYLQYYPAEKVTVVVLRNADYGGPGPAKIAQDLSAILFGERYEIPREPVVARVDPKIYDAYAGKYELQPGVVFTITREGDRLMLQLPGQPAVELFPESETKFFVRVVDAKFTFVRDEKGEVTHLIFDQGGEQRAKRIK
ncbi:MAG TPA: serine hydrolase [Blastocatellia bacterium]|nr:serine hydrolase [Blastocatellia bacterium]